MGQDWYKHAVVYQIYPRSFKDSNGDGVGDLQGIISKIDYIKSLGVDAVWLNPIYKSPNDDGGYDISDYYAIQPEFGTMADFDELLAKLHDRGIKLIMDLVLNHSSDEHPWFEQSKKSKDNPYRDYYFWRDGKNGGPPNNWPSFFGGSAWEKDEATNQYYLHLFSRKQPDLNWENPRLREEVNMLMKFWLDKGVDGLRLDVISAISKRTDFPNTDTKDFNDTIRKYYANGPRLKEFIAEARAKVWNHYNVMTVGEGPGITPQNAVDYLDEKNGLNMIFHFGHMFMDQGPGGRFDPIPWSLKDFKQIFKTWHDAFAKQGWGSVFLGNHDFPRMVSRWGNDKEYWEASSKLLITLLLSMRGTPFIFQGDEIGMTNTTLRSVADSRDIETHNGWEVAQKKGMDENTFLKRANQSGRDNARTPMQWTSGPFGGFSQVEPWMATNENASNINVENQSNTAHSILYYFQEMVKVRHLHKVLSVGTYHPITEGSEELFAFWRNLNQQQMLVLLNFSDGILKFQVPAGAKKVIGNYESGMVNELRPWEAIVYDCSV
ncbi:MAG: alpha-glucosidase [Bacteroidota bacterium]|jgi:oligo-1,6-glucosidase|nr:alpha-glucosidase [Cytophagales bacterium]